MLIHIDSCAAREKIVVTTRSSVYELIVLRAGQGYLVVRGGNHLPKFRRVAFLGSTADDGSVRPLTIDVGLRMKFVCGNQFLVTSAVQSICRYPCLTTSTECAQPADESRVARDSSENIRSAVTSETRT
jgi:hypothetical protein